jgi:ParB/RepB/Spo0J family partition protein
MPVQVKQIPLVDIHVPEVRITAVYDEELQEQLSSSIEAAGQLLPILVIKTDEGYELVDGLHRMQEAQKQGKRTIEAKIVPGDSITALTFNLVTNRTRGKVKASEMVKVIEELTTNHGLDSTQIAERTGFARDYIERLWKIAESDPMVRQALDMELIGVGTAFEVSRLPDPAQQQAMMSQVATYHMTTRQTKAFVDDTLVAIDAIRDAPVAAPVAPLPPPPPPTCECCHEESQMLVAVTLGPRCFGKIAYLVASERAQATPASPPPEAGGG